MDLDELERNLPKDKLAALVRGKSSKLDMQLHLNHFQHWRLLMYNILL